MDVHTARQLAHSPSLPHRLQRLVWDSGDVLARSSLVAVEELSPEVEELFLRERSDRLAASWARSSPRDFSAVDEVCSWVSDESALIALSGLPKLSTISMGHLVEKATAQSAARLLQRDDLADEDRAALVPRFLQGVEPAAASAGKVLIEKIGDCPLVWCEVVRHCLPTHAGVLASVPRTVAQDPGFQEASISVLESMPEPMERSSWNSPIVRLVKSLMASCTLDADLARRLHLETLRLCPDIAELTERRAGIDVPSLLTQLTCVPGRDCAPNNGHAYALETLAACVSFVDLPLDKVFTCGSWHIDELPEGVLVPASTQLRGDAGREVLASLETSCGPGSPTLVAAVKLLGLWPTAALEDPEPTLRVLAQTGWTPLERSFHTPAGTQAAIAMSFTPMPRLLQDKDYCAVIAKELDRLDSDSLEVALALMGEWQGSLSTLMEAAVELAGLASVQVGKVSSN